MYKKPECKLGISACLLGENVCYIGGHKLARRVPSSTEQKSSIAAYD